VKYVKPHGALYNTIRHEAQAEAVARAVKIYDAKLPLLGLPGTDSAIEREAAKSADVPLRGFRRPRIHGRRHADPTWPTWRAVDRGRTTTPQYNAGGRRGRPWHITSICTHSDTPGAQATIGAAVAVGSAQQAGYELRPFTK
jgi:UPF0271 protein